MLNFRRVAEVGTEDGDRREPPTGPPAAGRRLIGGVRKWATPAATAYPGGPRGAVEGVPSQLRWPAWGLEALVQ
jgi:hypothetical protein